MLRLLLLFAWVVPLSACSDDGSTPAERTWAAPQQVPQSGFPSDATLHAAGNGRTLAVWRGPNLGPDTTWPQGLSGIYASWKSPGGAWSPPVVVDDFLSQGGAPEAAVDADGNAMIVWSQATPRDEPDEVWVSRYVGGGPWREPELVGESGVGMSESPKVAMGQGGRAYVTWWPREGASALVVAVSALQPDGSWGPIETTDSRGGRGRPSALGLGVDPEGRAVFAWLTIEGTLVNRFTPGEGWGTTASLDIETEAALRVRPTVDIDPDGTVWALWTAELQSGRCVAAARNTPEGWDDPVLFRPSCGSTYGAALSADGAGGATAVWGEGFFDDTAALWIRYRPGEGWTSPEPAPLGVGTGPTDWALSARPAGDSVAIWYRSAIIEGSTFGGPAGVWTSVLDPEGVWSEPIRLSERGPLPGPRGYRFFPRIVSHARGESVALWVEELVEPRTDDPFGLWTSDFR